MSRFYCQILSTFYRSFLLTQQPNTLSKGFIVIRCWLAMDMSMRSTLEFIWVMYLALELSQDLYNCSFLVPRNLTNSEKTGVFQSNKVLTGQQIWASYWPHFFIIWVYWEHDHSHQAHYTKLRTDTEERCRGELEFYLFSLWSGQQTQKTYWTYRNHTMATWWYSYA